jgi:hypothetical protein
MRYKKIIGGLVDVRSLANVALGICLAFSIVGCKSKSESSKKVQKNTHLNLVVLIDLSDRISAKKNPLQADRDIKILKNIVKNFETVVRGKLFIKSNDALSIVIAPQPVDYQFEVSKWAGNLSIDLSSVRITEKRRFYKAKLDSLTSSIDGIYASAARAEGYLGADIWSFMRNDLKNYCKDFNGEAHVNKLVILTDGYIEFEKSVQSRRLVQGDKASYMVVRKFRGNSNWESLFDSRGFGLIPFENPCTNLSVMVAEVTPKNILDPSEFEILQKYWLSWFSESGVDANSVNLTRAYDSPNETMVAFSKFLKH